MKQIAAALFFAISLVGLYFKVEYAGWGIFIAFVLATS